jgi:hypothetical protein
MAIQTITYDNKSYINQNADIPTNNKVTDNDMNEIKSVVNNNGNELQTFLASVADYVIETGGDSSTNYYIKFNSGIMIQYGRLATSVAINTSEGNVYKSSSPITKNFATSFIDNVIYITVTANSSIQSFFLTGRTATSFSGTLIAYTSLGASQRSADFIAIGRWK